MCRHCSVETLARDIFTEVGNGLQRRRVDDFIQNFGSYLTDEYKCVLLSILLV